MICRTGQFFVTEPLDDRNIGESPASSSFLKGRFTPAKSKIPTHHQQKNA